MIEFMHTPALYAHVLASSLVAVVAFPIAALAIKGSRLHVAAGRTFAIGYVVICLTGLMLNVGISDSGNVRLLGIEFRTSAEQTAVADHEASLLVAGATLQDFAFLYLALSGWRVWARSRAVASGRGTRFDAAFGVLGMLNAGAFTIVALLTIDAFHAARHMGGSSSGAYILAIGLGLVYLLDAARDVHLAATPSRARRWWVVHARKMTMAQLFLVVSFAFRCTDPAKPQVWPLIAFFAVVVAAVVAAWHFQRTGARRGDGAAANA
jgi:hypothetical protein